ncbi:hypothetical protein F183_A03460 [Bryobacterales bacterium F-183]|nr:hypothetical protein F183_A03460 [Bryobacterales bacterium F-183]
MNGWASIDENIEYIRMEGAAQPGNEFVLKPKGGPRLRFRIGAFEPPHRYSDICKLLLAEMETVHSFTPDGNGTTIDVEIRVRGPLYWLWARVAGAKHAEGLPGQTEKFIAAAAAEANQGQIPKKGT